MFYGLNGDYILLFLTYHQQENDLFHTFVTVSSMPC